MAIKKNPVAKLLINDWEDGKDDICRHAPHLIFCYDNEEIGSASANCHTALSYLELALPSFKIGSCWGGWVTYAANAWPALIEELDVPKGQQIFEALMIGYAKFKYYRIPPRNEPEIIFRD